MPLDENCGDTLQSKRKLLHSAANAAAIAKNSLSLVSLFAIMGGVGYHISLPAGMGCAGFLVWIDLSISAYQRGHSAD